MGTIFQGVHNRYTWTLLDLKTLIISPANKAIVLLLFGRVCLSVQMCCKHNSSLTDTHIHVLIKLYTVAVYNLRMIMVWTISREITEFTLYSSVGGVSLLWVDLADYQNPRTLVPQEWYWCQHTLFSAMNCHMCSVVLNTENRLSCNFYTLL